MDLAEKLRTLREDRHHSVPELARASGVSIAYIRQIEGGVKKNPTAAVLTKLAGALGVPVMELLGIASKEESDAREEVPAALKDLLRRKGRQLDLRREDMRMLGHICFRGRRPESMEDWELIFLFLKRLLG